MSHTARHRVRSRQARFVPAPGVFIDEDVVRSFVTDAAHVSGGHAAGIAFPGDVEQVAMLVASAASVLPIGAQSSLTGGATPRGELVLSTRSLSRLDAPSAGEIRVGAGVPLKSLQQALSERHLYYPPVPTFDGAFVGGTIATNAAGAATFKYGATRKWVTGITLVLANGEVLELRRGDVLASDEGWFDIESSSGTVVRIPVPGYEMPDVPKLSAGYYAAPGMDLIDLFIGSEGTLAVIVDATLKVIQLPRQCSALLVCADEDQALRITRALRDAAQKAWAGCGLLDVAAIEYMDSLSLRFVSDTAFTAAGIQRPAPGAVILLVQLEVASDELPALAQLDEMLSAEGVVMDPVLALPGDAAAARLFELRESVPAGVNATIGSRKHRVPGLQKIAGDLIVPFERLGESLRTYRRVFEASGLEYAIWGHVSDGNLHPNVIPSTIDDVVKGIEAIRTIAGAVIAMGGAPLAEHGVGRSSLKQELLRELYGESGVGSMRAVKRALDPGWKLAPGVLFAPSRQESC